MSRLNATSIAGIQFRENETGAIRTQKLEFLRRSLLNATLFNRTLALSITSGLPSADPADPLYRLRVPDDWTLGLPFGDAGDAATAPTALIIKRDGVVNGTITFTGTVGVGAVTELLYPAGSLLEIYPPAVADPTLDDLAISIPVTVG